MSGAAFGSGLRYFLVIIDMRWRKIAGNFSESENLIRCDFALSPRNKNNDWNFKNARPFSSFRPEPSIRGAGQKDRGSEDKITALTTQHMTTSSCASLRLCLCPVLAWIMI